MMILMGDLVTVCREVAGDEVFVTGRVSGIVQKDSGDLKYFYIKGLDTQLWMNDGWRFQDDSIEFEMDEEEE